MNAWSWLRQRMPSVGWRAVRDREYFVLQALAILSIGSGGALVLLSALELRA